MRQERLLTESKETSQTILPCSNRTVSIKDDIAVKTSFSSEKRSTFETDSMLSSSKLSAPIFTKKAKLQEDNTEMEKTETNKTAADDTGKVKKVEEVKNPPKVAELHQVQPNRPFNPFAKSLNNQENKAGEVDQGQSSRPSNPFLKSSVK